MPGVFKGYGLINKALEAMASGVPVIGGAAAFNGVEGFEGSGAVCRPRSTPDFVSAICDILKDRGGKGRNVLVTPEERWSMASSAGKKPLTRSKR